MVAILSQPQCVKTDGEIISTFSNSGPISQIPDCSCSISHNAPFRTEMYTFLFWMEHCGIWNRCILGFVNQVNWTDLGQDVLYDMGNSTFCLNLLYRNIKNWNPKNNEAINEYHKSYHYYSKSPVWLQSFIIVFFSIISWCTKVHFCTFLIVTFWCDQLLEAVFNGLFYGGSSLSNSRTNWVYSSPWWPYCLCLVL